MEGTRMKYIQHANVDDLFLSFVLMLAFRPLSYSNLP